MTRPPCSCFTHSAAQHAESLKGEDLLLSETRRWLAAAVAEEAFPSCSSCGQRADEYQLHAVFDGHNGVAAATHCQQRLAAVLESHLPLGAPPHPSGAGFGRWAEGVQRALVRTMCQLHFMFSELGVEAGTTATVVLVACGGRVVTCAAVGDSRALLGTGVEVVRLSVDHRIASNERERARLKMAGAIVAPLNLEQMGPATDPTQGIGPLRLWPGGLCLSRAVGDFDVGQNVLPLPHVCQVLLPETGGRIVLASDGVWDAWPKKERLNSMLWRCSLQQAPQKLISNIMVMFGELRDDASVIVADILPPSHPGFASMAGGSSRRSADPDAVPGGGCLCFGRPRPAAAEGSQQPAAPGAATMLCNFDAAVALGLVPPGPGEEPVGWVTRELRQELLGMLSGSNQRWRALTVGGPPPLGDAPVAARLSDVELRFTAADSEEYSTRFGPYAALARADSAGLLGDHAVPPSTMPRASLDAAMQLDVTHRLRTPGMVDAGPNPPAGVSAKALLDLEAGVASNPRAKVVKPL